MKVALVFVIVAVSLTVASAAISCIFDKDKCAEDECCVKVTNLLGKCMKLKKEDERCTVKDRTAMFKDHVHKVMCPCAEGLKCVEKDGLVGKLVGTCQVDSSEITGE